MDYLMTEFYSVIDEEWQEINGDTTYHSLNSRFQMTIYERYHDKGFLRRDNVYSNKAAFDAYLKSQEESK